MRERTNCPMPTFVAIDADSSDVGATVYLKSLQSKTRVDSVDNGQRTPVRTTSQQKPLYVLVREHPQSLFDPGAFQRLSQVDLTPRRTIRLFLLLWKTGAQHWPQERPEMMRALRSSAIPLAPAPRQDGFYFL